MFSTASELKIPVYINVLITSNLEEYCLETFLGASFAFFLWRNSGSLFPLHLACAWKISHSLPLVVGRNFLHGCLTRNNELKLREGNFRMDVRNTPVTERHFELWNSLQKEKLETPVLRTFKDNCVVKIITQETSKPWGQKGVTPDMTLVFCICISSRGTAASQCCSLSSTQNYDNP